MAQTSSPFFNIQYGWELGNSGWGDPINTNLQVMSFLDKGAVDDFVAVLPGSPANGDSVVYTVDNQLYFRIGGNWLFVTPQEGMEVNKLSDGTKWQWSGSAWVEVTFVKKADLADGTTPAKGASMVGDKVGTADLSLRSVGAFPVILTDRRSRSLYEFLSGAYDPLDDHTTTLQAAAAAATSDGFDIEVPPVDWNYEAHVNMTRSMRGVQGLSRIICQTVDGRGARWSWNNSEDLYVSDLIWYSPNLPVSPSNNGGEADGFMRIENSKRVHCERMSYINSYGLNCLFRNVEDGEMIQLHTYQAWKDSFHITGASKNIIRANCSVTAGGDDAFAVVGYVADGARPEEIIDIGNRIRGVKFARGFAYVGSKRVQNIGCKVDGFIPADWFIDSSYKMGSGLYIASEASFNTFGNEDIEVDGIQMINCGNTVPSAAVYHALQINGRAGQVTKNIKVRDPVIINSANRGISAGGASGALIQDLDITGIKLDTTGGTNSGAEFAFIDGLKVEGTFENTGGRAIFVSNNCAGSIDMNVRSKDLNTSSSANLAVITVQTGSTSLEEVRLEVDVIQQTNTLLRTIECNNLGRLRKARVRGTSPYGTVTGGTNPSITVGASPFVFTNPLSVPAFVGISGGTVSLVERAFTESGGTAYGTITGFTTGSIVIEPGESLRVTYSSAPTMSFAATVA